MKFKALAHFLPLSDMRSVAWEETRDITERHDVPSGDSVPEDLRDVIGHYEHTKNGYRIAGRVLPSDLLQGSQSSASIAWMSLFACIAMLVAVLSVWGPWTRYIALPVIAISTVLVLFTEGFLKAIIWGVVLALGFEFSVMTQSPYLLDAICLFYCFLPWLSAKLDYLFRVSKLAKRGTEIAHEGSGEFSGSHVKARQMQADNAIKDGSPFLTLGTATGTFHCVQDTYAPDPELPFGLSCKDLSTHVVIFGATGTGKTAGVIRPLTNAYLDTHYGGAIILDGKGQLAAEFRTRENYVFVEPGKADLALLEGLEPADIVQAIASTQESGPAGENGSFFQNSGQQMLLAAAVIADALKKRAPDKYPLSFEGLYALLDRMANREMAGKYVAYLKPSASTDPLLSDALQYYEVKLPQMDERTRSNVLSICTSWLSPVMSHPKIRPWAKLSHGSDVTSCLRGGMVGINVPSSEYGEAGRVITALVKARIFRAVRQRPANWKDNGTDQPILMVVDEAQAVIGRMELDVFPVARSLGLMGVYATQSVDEFLGRFGESQALALLNNFRSFVVFASSTATYHWAAERIGTSVVRRASAVLDSADPAYGAKLASGSPIFDRGHPDRTEMRSLARTGVQGFWTVAQMGWGILQGRLGINLDYKTMVSSTEEQILTPARAATHLATPFQAVSQVMRGGVQRRDVITVHPKFD